MPLGALTAQQVTWYLTRSTGAVALLLLTGSVALGILEARRVGSTEWPRFLIDSLHRNVALLALCFVLAHILTTVLNTFTSIGLVEAVVPFVSAYRPLWLGLGAVAFDLLLAVTATSLLRRRISRETWRAVHWLVYVSWPVALLHGIGTGSDTNGLWMLAIDALCVLAVLAALALRIDYAWRGSPAYGLLTLAGALALLALLGVWMARGPLGSEWPRRSGTPRSLLGNGERRAEGAD